MSAEIVQEDPNMHICPSGFSFFEIRGRVDSTNAHLIEDDITSQVGEDMNRIVISFVGAKYVSGAGLRELVSLHKKCRKFEGGVVLVCPEGRVKEVLDLSGLSSVFSIFGSEVELADKFKTFGTSA